MYKRQALAFDDAGVELTRARAGGEIVPGETITLTLSFGPVSYTHLTLPTSDLV